MSLTKGTGPFGEQPVGAFNFEPDPPQHVLDVERTPRRARVLLAGEPVADSDDVRLCTRPAREDVRTELLESSDTTTRCPYKGIAHYWSLRTQSRHEKDLVWTCPEPFHDAEAVRGLLCFPQDRADVQVDGTLA